MRALSESVPHVIAIHHHKINIFRESSSVSSPQFKRPPKADKLYKGDEPIPA
jgi:hypothetical protein